MKISTKGRYGLRSMVDLAIHSKNEHIPLSTIAERQGVSENYLEQVFSILRKAGLVSSIKGSSGGYTLADSPSNITVGKVLRALEGEIAIVDESTSGEENNVGSVEYCIRKNVWEKVNESINNVIDSITLEDLANEYRRLNGNLNLMYYI